MCRNRALVQPIHCHRFSRNHRQNWPSPRSRAVGPSVANTVPKHQGLLQSCSSTWTRWCPYTCAFRWEQIQGVRHETQWPHLRGHLQRRPWNKVYHWKDQRSQARWSGSPSLKIPEQDDQTRHDYCLDQIRLWAQRVVWSQNAESYRVGSTEIHRENRCYLNLLWSSCYSERQNLVIAD